MKSLHWQIALSDPVIIFPGAATQFALASFVRILTGFLKEFLLVSYNFNTKSAFFKRTCKSGEEKEGRTLPFQLNNLHRSCRSTWERKGKLEIIYPICLLHKSWNRPPWYSVLFMPKSFTCFSKALLQLPKGFHFQVYFWGGTDSYTIWFSRWQQNKGQLGRCTYWDGAGEVRKRKYLQSSQDFISFSEHCSMLSKPKWGLQFSNSRGLLGSYSSYLTLLCFFGRKTECSQGWRGKGYVSKVVYQGHTRGCKGVKHFLQVYQGSPGQKQRTLWHWQVGRSGEGKAVRTSVCLSGL